MVSTLHPHLHSKPVKRAMPARSCSHVEADPPSLHRHGAITRLAARLDVLGVNAASTLLDHGAGAGLGAALKVDVLEVEGVDVAGEIAGVEVRLADNEDEGDDDDVDDEKPS